MRCKNLPKQLIIRAIFFLYTFLVTIIVIIQLVSYNTERENKFSSKDKDKGVYLFGNPLALCTGGINSQLEYLLASREPGLVIDVGAFDGLDAVRFAKNGRHRVFSFEPVPSKLERIRQNIEKSGLGNLITFFPVALSNYTGTADFFVAKDKLGKAKMNKNVFGTEQDAFTIPWDPIHSVAIPVKVGQLDDYIKSEEVLYLKVDAQGHDGEVLLGAKKAIEEKRIKYINFEISPGLSQNAQIYVDVIKWLGNFGYSCFDCKFFNSIDRRGKSEHVLKIDVENFVSLFQKTTLMQRGINVKRYTDLLCTSL